MNKIISIDPKKRVTEESLEAVRSYLKDLKSEDVKGLILVHHRNDDDFSFHLLGKDLESLGIFQIAVDLYKAAIIETMDVELKS